MYVPTSSVLRVRFRNSADHQGRRREKEFMVRPTQAFVVGSGEGQIIPGPAGGPSTIKARTETTNGSFALLEVTIGSLQGPPAHVHRREDEMWFLLDGRFRFMADDELFEVAPGGFVFVPRGTAHCFQNLEDRPSRILVMFTPSGMERFFEEHAMLPPGPVDPDRYRAIAERSWMDVAGPPLAVSHPLERPAGQ
jgi:mannose-6-phosphate isomerase-like protein (cupin superfamily)